MVKILAIESSCDETAAAVVSDGNSILSNTIASQIPVHRLYGGVVPGDRQPPPSGGDRASSWRGSVCCWL